MSASKAQVEELFAKHLMERRVSTMAKPYFYINVHQTVWVGLAATAFAAYLFDFKGFRTSVNALVTGRPETYVKKEK